MAGEYVYRWTWLYGRPVEGVYRYTSPGCRQYPDNVSIGGPGCREDLDKVSIDGLGKYCYRGYKKYGNRGGTVKCVYKND